jgi:hypothetical protein
MAHTLRTAIAHTVRTAIAHTVRTAIAHTVDRYTALDNNLWASSQNCNKQLLALSCSSVGQAWETSAPKGRIFMKFYIWEFFEILS